MIKKLKRLIYYKFLKVRDVFSLEFSEKAKVVLENKNIIRVIKKDNYNSLNYIFEIFEEEDGDVMCFTNLAVNNKTRHLWHDNYPIKTKEGLIYGSFVYERFRGKGLYVKILNYVTEHMRDKDVDRLVAVVESRNFASARSHKKSGYKLCKKNYLVKFFGKNVLTIFNKPFRCYFAGKKSNSI